jgi:hypothetical protein
MAAISLAAASAVNASVILFDKMTAFTAAIVATLRLTW